MRPDEPRDDVTSPGSGGPAASADTAAHPRRLGRYRVLHRLGQGGMGVVVAAEDEALGRRVAVKTIVEADESARRRFRREARAAASVNHPNVCQIYEIGEDSGQLYIVMELLEGEPLSARLARGALPIADAQAVGRSVLAALAALHSVGIVHRDLKPSNVFLTPHGVKLLDFGLAAPLPTDLTLKIEAGAEPTRPGLLLGTPRYMAPEQILGRQTDARTDLFSTAAILYEAIAGRPAFLGTTLVEVLSTTIHEQPPALAGDTAAVAFDRVLRHALAKRPEDRPASATEMLAELEAIGGAGSPLPTALARPLTRLVVVPFRILRADPEIDFLSFALADAIAGSLSGLPSVVIRSSAVAARFAGEAPDLKALATQADVDRVLMGTLLRAGQQVRATAQLVEAPSGTLISSQTLQVPAGDFFRLQDELAGRIVEALSPAIGGRETPRRRAAPASARAYEFYLRGSELGRYLPNVPAALDLFRQCVDEDPGFAPGWAQLGRCHRLLAKYFLERPDDNLRLADDAYTRALALDPELPLAHKLYAHREAEMGRAPGALVRLIGLARTNRHDPEIFAGLVHACRYCGLLDASEAAHAEARRLDPHISTSVVYTLWARGDMARVIAETSDVADFEVRTMAFEALGRTEEARRTLGQPHATVGVGIIAVLHDALLHLLDRTPHLPAALAGLVAGHRDPEALFLYGACQAHAGDLAVALTTLTASVEGGFTVPEALRRHPWLEPLRGEAAFAALVERAEAVRGDAGRAFHEAGGPALLGV
jgi:serine/threonine protein kinase